MVAFWRHNANAKCQRVHACTRSMPSYYHYSLHISFYRAADAIFGRVGRIASEEVVLHLILGLTKCIPILLYGLEACPLRKTDFNSLDFVLNRFFMKLFQTDNIDLVKCCQSFFCFALPSAIHDKSASKFDLRYKNYSNLFCQMISSL